MANLTDVPYMKFPFEVDEGGPVLSDRRDHLRELIEQVLFTDPGERVYRPEFGAGVRSLVFEPASSALREVTRQRLTASLGSVLQGEVDPKSLRIEVESQPGREEELLITIAYTLATIGRDEQQTFTVSPEGS